MWKAAEKNLVDDLNRFFSFPDISVFRPRNQRLIRKKRVVAYRALRSFDAISAKMAVCCLLLDGVCRLGRGHLGFFCRFVRLSTCLCRSNKLQMRYLRIFERISNTGGQLLKPDDEDDEFVCCSTERTD
jgi:hypothetical protein